MSLEHLKGYFRLGPPSMRPSRRPMSGGHWHGHMALFVNHLAVCSTSEPKNCPTKKMGAVKHVVKQLPRQATRTCTRHYKTSTVEG